MTISRTLIPIVVAIAFLGAFGYALDRYLAFEDSRTAQALRAQEIDEARHLILSYPEAFGPNAGKATKSDLKGLVQQSSAKNGVLLLYLNESERDAGEKVKERNVVARAINVPHAKLVAFLADLESRGGGARIKEIRLKPAADRSDVYQEAESVLTYRWVSETDNPKKEEAR